MGHTKIKNFIGFAFLLIWILSLTALKYLRSTLLLDPSGFQETVAAILLYFNIPIFFIWLLIGMVTGLIVTAITGLFVIILFFDGAYALPILTLIITSAIGYKLRQIFENEAKEMEVRKEKLSEELNLLSAEMKSKENDSLRMQSSFERITHLKSIAEDYSRTLLRGEVVNSIVENSFELFDNADRVLLYLIDTEKQELMLMHSKRRKDTTLVKSKNGDIFDRWVLKHRMPLLVGDVNKDFRFSLDENSEGHFNSVIDSPLTSEHKVFGILRIDSRKKNSFNQSDLRFLDIISDLSSVSLQNAILYQKVQDLAIHDSLTGLYVHNYFLERLKSEVKRSMRSNIDISLLMLDMDNFKEHNDKYGHNTGDLALKHVSATLESFARPGDLISRYGGEEFMLLFLNKDKSSASEIAENIRERISQTPFVLRREKIKITVSGGVASCPSEEKTADELIRLVDSRLYKAKRSGKNKIWSK